MKVNNLLSALLLLITTSTSLVSFTMLPSCYTVDFTNSEDEYPANEPVGFIDLTNAGGGTSYTWTLDGTTIGTSSTVEFADYEYDQDYELGLRVTTASCDKYVVKTFRVELRAGGNGVVAWP